MMRAPLLMSSRLQFATKLSLMLASLTFIEKRNNHTFNFNLPKDQTNLEEELSFTIQKSRTFLFSMMMKESLQNHKNQKAHNVFCSVTSDVQMSRQIILSMYRITALLRLTIKSLRNLLLIRSIDCHLQLFLIRI
jgi:hypothetical protein